MNVLRKAAFAVAGLLVGPGLARAYVRTTTETAKAMRWPDPPQISVDLYTRNPPPYLDQETLVSAVQAAAATWSRPTVACTDLEIAIRPFDDESAPVAFDGTNRITFRRDEWRKMPCEPEKEPCGLYDSRAIALTSVFASRSDGRILDSDMELNAVNFFWADVVRDGRNIPTVDDKQLHDLQNVVTHEFGHLIGLDHNCYEPSSNPRGRPNDQDGNPVPNCTGADANTRAATMYNSAGSRDVSKRDLTEDDVQAACDVYPVGSGGDQGGGGCATMGTAARTSPREAGHLVPLLGTAAAIVLSGRRRRRR